MSITCIGDIVDVDGRQTSSKLLTSVGGNEVLVSVTAGADEFIFSVTVEASWMDSDDVPLLVGSCTPDVWLFYGTKLLATEQANFRYNHWIEGVSLCNGEALHNVFGDHGFISGIFH